MTYLEKLKRDHPELSKEQIDDIVHWDCPHEYEYGDNPSWCDAGTNPFLCIDCWNRVMTSMEDAVEMEKTETKIAYICDRQACENCDYPTCQHTTDISHAVNFEEVGENRYFEKGE